MNAKINALYFQLANIIEEIKKIHKDYHIKQEYISYLRNINCEVLKDIWNFHPQKEKEGGPGRGNNSGRGRKITGLIQTIICSPVGEA